MHNKLFRFVTLLEIPCNLCAENFGNYVLDLELRLHNKMSNFGFKEGRKHFHKKRGAVAVKSKIQSDKIHCTFFAENSCNYVSIPSKTHAKNELKRMHKMQFSSNKLVIEKPNNTTGPIKSMLGSYVYLKKVN